MSHPAHVTLGSVVSLWRYPVKSMLGEELNAAEVTERGLLGDRAYALVDQSDGKVASAKNPRKWTQLFDFRLPGYGHRLCAARGHLLRLCRSPCLDHGAPRPAAGAVSAGAV